MASKDDTSKTQAQTRRGAATATAASNSANGLIVTVEQDVLSKALSAVVGTVAKRVTIPILEMVLLEVGEASLTLTSTNLDQEASVQLGCTVDASGKICVEARALAGIVARMKGELLLQQDGQTLSVSAARSRASLPTLPASDFQTFERVEGVDFELASGSLAAGIGAVLHCVSTEEQRYYLNGVYIERSDGDLIFTSTDGYRLATIKVTAGMDADIEGAIIPRAALSDVMKLCERAAGPVSVTLSERMLAVAAKGECYRTKLVDGQFPDWRRVYPTGAGTRIALPRKELIEALGVALAASREKSSGVKITATEGRLSIVARSDGALWAEGIVEWPDIPPCVPFGLNGKYLMQALDKIAADEVELVVTDDTGPIRVETGDQLRQVIMPLRV